jgi:sulfate permease, SulP family
VSISHYFIFSRIKASGNSQYRGVPTTPITRTIHSMHGWRSLLPQPSDFNRQTVGADVFAGVTVAIVALPLALGFGITSGAGATAGLHTAIVAGIVAAIFGGSSFQISGPTGAMTVVLLPLVASYGVGALAPVGVMAGIILLVLAVTRVGRLIRLIPYPVVTGFTAGIAIIIFLQQIPALLGVRQPVGHHVVSMTLATLREARGTWQPTTVGVGLATIVIMVLWGRSRRLRRIPASMAALLITTVGSLAPGLGDMPRVGEIPTGLPSTVLPRFTALPVTDLARAALIVAVLAALESLLSAVVADGMTVGERHDPDRELFGQGLANVASALVGGIPATAALARTAVNVRSGARTRLAAIVHGLTLAAIVIMAAPLAAHIPLATLAGILTAVAARMVERVELREITRATRSDAATMLLTLTVTVAFDLILAIEIGLILAGLLFVVRMARHFDVDTTTITGPVEPAHEPASAMPAVTVDDLLTLPRVHRPDPRPSAPNAPVRSVTTAPAGSRARASPCVARSPGWTSPTSTRSSTSTRWARSSTRRASPRARRGTRTAGSRPSPTCSTASSTTRTPTAVAGSSPTATPSG